MPLPLAVLPPLGLFVLARGHVPPRPLNSLRARRCFPRRCRCVRLDVPLVLCLALLLALLLLRYGLLVVR